MSELKKINEFEWEVPQKGDMNVPGKIFASEKLIDAIKQDKTMEQIHNVSTLPGILKASIAMPDAHQGYGFSIGGVAAFDMETGIVTPGGVGFDINCGVRILATNITKEEFLKKRKEVLQDIYREVPSGVGKGHKEKLSDEELKDVLTNGVQWAVKKGYATEDDLQRCEEYGCMKGANPDDVSQRAFKRGLPQLGTLGAGNHFLEIQEVSEIFNEEIAKAFGVKQGNVVIMIHCGSRGLGHQVASDYIQKMEKEYGFENLPDRELINAPINSELGKQYISAMNCAVNFAFVNRQLIMHDIRKVLKNYFPENKNHLVYDVCHNIAKFEEFDGKKVCVHRKGATRAFGPGRIEIPEVYRQVGQPVIIPGSMGTSSFLLVGTKKAEELSWGSTAHGAGRVMSRSQAMRTIRGEDVKKALNDKDIEIEAGSWKGVAEEAPEVYKDIDEVIRVSDGAGLAKKVARLKPLAVIKG